MVLDVTPFAAQESGTRSGTPAEMFYRADLHPVDSADVASLQRCIPSSNMSGLLIDARPNAETASSLPKKAEAWSRISRVVGPQRCWLASLAPTQMLSSTVRRALRRTKWVGLARLDARLPTYGKLLFRLRQFSAQHC